MIDPQVLKYHPDCKVILVRTVALDSTYKERQIFICKSCNITISEPK